MGDISDTLVGTALGHDGPPRFPGRGEPAFSESLHALPQMHLKWGQLNTIVGFFVVFSSD